MALKLKKLDRRQMQELQRQLEAEEYERYLKRRKLLMERAFAVERERFLYGA